MASIPTPAGHQRRTDVRVEVDRLPAEIWTPRLMVWDFVTGTMLNLSAGGALVEHNRPLPLQLDVQMRFRLPELEELLSIPATVVRALHTGEQTYQLGLRFAFNHESKRDKIARWVFLELARRHREWVEQLEEERLKRARAARHY